ncbi:MAG: endolytic transglycosylase MltG [Patescibacteria group bacterium]
MNIFKKYNYRNWISSAKLFCKNVYGHRCFSIYLSWCPKMPSKRKQIFFVVGILFFSLGYFYLIKAPSHFPIGSIITVEEGVTLNQVADDLRVKKVIKSPFIFSSLAKLLMNERGVMAGDYFFEKDYSVVRIAWRTIRGKWGITPTRVRIVEGATIFDVAETLKKYFDIFDKERFIRLAEKEEGFLFPDTYYFLPNVSPETVIKTMKNNFNNKIQEIAEEINDSGKTLEEIVIMASILEKEARTLKSKQIISGILWKRIDINMPLQVDAVFPYIMGKNTYQLTLDDLKTESPYNTYANKGLPIGPIANPSIYSLLAAATPITTDYLFYLSDRSGNMYYAEDFEGHKMNRYLYMN